MSRWAIPFFFIISGYFLASKAAHSKQWSVLPVIERLTWMFILWNLIYSPIFVIKNGWLALFKLITLPTFIYFGVFTHLWYLPSMIVGYLTFSLTSHYRVKYILPIVSIIGISMGLISGSYNKFIDLGFPLEHEISRTWLCIPFLYIGSLFHEKGHPSGWVAVFLILLGGVSQVLEARFLYDQFEISAYDHQFLVGTIPFSIGMAALALGGFRFFQNPIFANMGAEYSLGVYLIHPAVIFAFQQAASRFLPYTSAIWEFSAPVVVLSISLGVLFLIRRYMPLLFNIFFGTQIS